MEEEGDSNLCIDTDSDTAEKKEGAMCKVKWTLEEVSEKTHKWICLFQSFI